MRTSSSSHNCGGGATDRDGSVAAHSDGSGGGDEARLENDEHAFMANPRTTSRYDRHRISLDRHAAYTVAAFVAGATNGR